MISIEWAGQSDPGLVRTNNEDALSVVSLSDTGVLTREKDTGAAGGLSGCGAIFTVSDGVGGGQAGEVASAIAVESVPANIAGDDLPTCFTSWDRGRRMENALRRANGQIRQEAADPARSGMCATVSALWLLPDRAVFGHSGDSRIYRYRSGELRQLTHDQSEVAGLVRTGQITEAEARVAPNRNVIEQALGIQEQSFSPEIDWVEWMAGDLYLLCSDGLVDGLDDAQLAELLRAAVAGPISLPALVKELITKGNAASGKDNITVLLVRIGRTSEPLAAISETNVGAVSPKGSTSGPRNVAALGSAAIAGAMIALSAWWWFHHRPLTEEMRAREVELQQTIQDEREMTTDARKRLRAEAQLLQQQVDELTGRKRELNARLEAERVRFHALEQTLAKTQSDAVETEARLRAEFETRLKAFQEAAAALEQRLVRQETTPSLPAEGDGEPPAAPP